MDRVFLDANILFSAAHRPEARMLRLWSLPNVELITSAYAIEEVERNLDEPDQFVRLRALLNSIRLVADRMPGHSMPEGVILPADDQPILLAAIAAGATHLLTGNSRDFGPYYGQVIDGVLILKPAAYPPVVPT